MNYKVMIGGLMRCCLASLDEHMEGRTDPPAEGEKLECKYCSNGMVFCNGAWEWEDKDGVLNYRM